MKRSRSDQEFTKIGISYHVYSHYMDFAVINILIGMLSGALLFNASFLKASGLSPSQVGLFSSLASLASLVAPLIWGVLSDKYQTVKKIIVFSLFAMLFIYFPIPLYARIGIGTFTLATFMIPVQALFCSVPESMSTAWVMQAHREHPDIQFGVIRMFFTAAYALANFLFMLIIAKTSVNVIFIGHAFFSILLILALTRIPDIAPPVGKAKTSLRDMHINKIFKNPRIIVYILFMSVACIPSSSISLFTPYLMEDIGSDPALLGGLTAIRSLVALPVLYLSNRLIRRLGSTRSILIGIALYIIQQIIFVFCKTLPQAVFGSILGGVAVGIANPSEVSFVNEQAPEGLLATTQTICGTVYSMAGVICNLFGGITVEHFGIRVFYAATAVLLTAGSLFFYFSMHRISLREGENKPL